MDFQMSTPTTNTKDNWVGPGIYRLTSATHEGKYLSVNDQDKLVVSSNQSDKTDTKQQWQISYAGKRHLENDPKVAFVAEFFIINVKTGKYLISDDKTPSMDVSSPKFDGVSRWVLANPPIEEKNQTFDNRYIFYRFHESDPKKALACNGTAINLTEYDSNKANPSGDCQWNIVDNITK